MEPLSGLDGAFLALETPAAHFHVAAVLVLDPPEDRREPPGARLERIRAMVAARLHLVPPLRQRAVRMPLDMWPPLWVDDPDFDLDRHLRRARVPAPGGSRQLDELVAELLSRPLPPDRPLWEMVAVEGLAGGRTALVVKVHHAILDGVSGASVLAAFLDGSARPSPITAPPAWDPPPLPSAAELVRYAVTSLLRQPDAVLDVVQTGLDAAAGVMRQNRRLAADGELPPPFPFGAPRTSLNGTLSSARHFATLSVPLEDVHLVRTAFRRAAGRPTFNDVLLSAVGTAVSRLLDRRGEVPDRPLVGLVPVSTRRPSAGRGRVGGSADGATGPDGLPPLGNQLSGMLVALPGADGPPVARLAATAAASRKAKAQERVAWAKLLEGVAQATPPVVTSWAARCASAVRLFDVVPPLCNLTVSTVPGPAADLWCAGCRLVAAFPAGPVAHGVGLNVTAMTYRGTVHVGLLGCSRRVPDIDALVALLDEALAELVAAATAAAR